MSNEALFDAQREVVERLARAAKEVRVPWRLG